MVRTTALLLVLVAGGCATREPRTAPSRYSLVGIWAFKDPITRVYPYDSTDCGTDFGARYGADGTYIGYEEEGRWSLAGDVLTETTERELDDMGEMRTVAPSTAVFRLRWLSRNHLNTESGGEVTGMIRCSALP